MSKVNEINLALKDFSNGKKEKAYNKLKAIFKKNIDDEKLRFNLAVIAQSLNRNEEAKENYIFLVKKNNNIKAMVNLYLLYIGEDNFSKALEIINKLIKDNKNHGIYRDKAFVLYKLKKYDESISICEDFLKNKFDINIMNILGLNYLSKNDFNKSEEIFKKALKIDKHSALILNSLGRNYHERRESKKAEEFYLKAFNLNKNSYEIINNLAGFYREEGKYIKSIELYKSALKINPNNPTLINNLAKAYFDTNNIELAKNYCLKALKLNKNDGNIQKILSLIYFRQQNYKLGWSYFDGRLNLSDFVETNSSIYNIRKILFQKEILDKNLNLLVIREQGIGDEILYGTIYNDLLMSHENVTIECDKRLKNIFCNSFPKFKNSFVEFGKISLNKDLLNNFDAAIYAGSLGKFFRNDIKNFNNGNYLIPENILIQKSDIELKKLSKKFNIGISWKSFKNRYANEKSLSLKDLNNIFSSEDCNFINLQYGNVQNEISKYNSEYNKNIVTLKYLDIFNDFDNLASVLKSLDLFITVSNSTAHLAGSIGVKTLLIKPENHALFHYWNQRENKTPWYESITLINKSDIINKKNLLENYLDI